MAKIDVKKAVENAPAGSVLKTADVTKLERLLEREEKHYARQKDYNLRKRVERQLYELKAKKAGIKVTRAEVDEAIANRTKK